MALPLGLIGLRSRWSLLSASRRAGVALGRDGQTVAVFSVAEPNSQSRRRRSETRLRLISA